MLNKSNPKGLTQANFSAHISIEDIIWIGLGLLVMTTYTRAEPVYRCGDDYSPFAQCPHGHSTEVKPSLGLRNSSSTKGIHVTNEMQEAEALEKKRLQTERQVAQTAPVRFSAAGNPSNTNLNASPAHSSMPSKGKHTRKLQTPYFTAKDPNAPAKKKSTAKAVPVNPSSTP